MKAWLKIAFGLVLCAAASVAQDAPKDKDQVTTDSTASKAGAPRGSAADEKAPHTTAKPDTTTTPGLTDVEKRSYALGVGLASDIAKHGTELNPDRVMQGMRDALTGGKLLISVEEINATLTALQNDQHQKMALAMKELAEKNKKEGEAFLAANRAKEGVVSLASGLQYKVLKAAEGKKPTLDDRVVCNYQGTLIDGTEIDSSYRRNEPSTFPLKGVIKGWAEALQLMPVGSKWQIVLPPELAYGERGSRKIGPNATLVFEVELVSILDKAQNAETPRPGAAKEHGPS